MNQRQWIVQKQLIAKSAVEKKKKRKIAIEQGSASSLQHHAQPQKS